MLLKLQKDFSALLNKFSNLSLRVARMASSGLGVFNKINVLPIRMILAAANRFRCKARSVNVNRKSQ